jgi:hypothetical protein
MSYDEGDPAVASCVHAFLTALANDDELLTSYIKNRRNAIETWFEQNPGSCSREGQAEALQILLNGDFDAAKRHLATLPPPDPDDPDSWLTTTVIWLV